MFYIFSYFTKCFKGFIQNILTASATIIQDDVFGDEYNGLWKICYDRPNRGFDSSCFERVGDGV